MEHDVFDVVKSSTAINKPKEYRAPQWSTTSSTS